MNRFLLATILLLISVVAKGQGCPNGSVALPTGACGSQADANEMRQSDYDARVAERMRDLNAPRWEDRYGAIASDVKTGSIGWVSASRSKREARKAAIEDCGGGGCKVVMEGRNTCLAAAWGGGAAGYAGAVGLENAELSALGTCKKTGGTDCKITYSACSLPVRVR